MKDRGDFVEQMVAESGSFLNTAVAFANGRGGRIIFYGDSGEGFLIGTEIISYIDKITQQIFDSCEPRIFPRVGVEIQDGRQVVVVEIFPGMQKPYFIKGLGMMAGTYVRIGGATRIAEPYQVQELLLSGTNSSADQLATSTAVSDVEIEEFCRSLYNEAKKSRSEEDVVRLQKEDLLAWKLLREEEGEWRATNGWHLLTGTAEELYPEGFIQCAEYLGTTRLDFVGGEEFVGTLTEQVENATAYVYARLVERGIAGLSKDLLRRLLARAACQRNYEAPGRIALVIYEDRLEITVPGLLEEDMTIWKLKTGFSKIRNRAIAATFLYRGMITGFQSILPELYRAAKQAHLPEPAVSTLGDSVRINIYCRPVKEVLEERADAAPATLEAVLTAEAAAIEEAAATEEAVATEETAPTTEESATEEAKPVVHSILEQEGAALPDVEIAPKEREPLLAASDADNALQTDLLLENDKEESLKEQLLHMIRENPKITQKALKEALGVSIAMVKRVMTELSKAGVIERRGTNRSGTWHVLEEKKENLPRP